MFEEVWVPAVWTVAHRGYSGNRRLDVWIYREENTAIRAVAELAMSCGVDEDPVWGTFGKDTTVFSALIEAAQAHRALRRCRSKRADSSLWHRALLAWA